MTCETAMLVLKVVAYATAPLLCAAWLVGWWSGANYAMRRMRDGLRRLK